MKSNQITASILLIAFFTHFLLLPARAQVGDPFEITFGQPGIWSLEQAHYLLAQMRERSMRIRANELENLDPNSAEASRINLIRQMFGLNAQFTQRPDFGPGLTNAVDSPTPVPSPEPVPSPAVAPSPLDGTILSTLLSGDFLRKLNSDSKLNATTRLDNHVQLQYEIIAKQLTLLRDEVGPDERLVFLELPQSIYSSGTDTKGKVVQTYWEIGGFTEYNREADVERAIVELEKKLAIIKERLTEADAEVKRLEKILEPAGFKTLAKNSKEAKDAYEKARNLCLSTKPTSVCAQDEELIKLKATFDNEKSTLEKFKEDNKSKVEEFEKAQAANNQRVGVKEFIEAELARLRISEPYRTAAKEATEIVDRISQEGANPNNEIVDRVINQGKTRESSKFKKGTEQELNVQVSNLNRKTRTVDIIPRQSSLNINDIQETVKSSVLGGAFSFLFGLGLRTNFQRQRDTFEQFLHQDIYASGFGKGENIFGWTFGPVPGTKRVASGVRTTYAVVVVPRKAEALIVNARGCYFSRLKFQPRGVMDPIDENAYKADTNGRRWQDDDVRECFDKKQYILPIPNGGDARGFWLTSVDFANVEKGQRAVVSIKGKNFTSQVGALVNGVPLQQVVELTRKLPSRDLINADNCEGEICGKYEIIDNEEITLVFKMPKDFVGTPEITIVGPGRAVSLNEVALRIEPRGSDPCPKCKIMEKPVPFIFGTRPPENLALTDLQVFLDDAALIRKSAFLSGAKFAGKEQIYVNGEEITVAADRLFISPKEYRLRFDLKDSGFVTVLVKQCFNKATKKPDDCLAIPNDELQTIATVVKTFPVIISQFNITNATALRYDSLKNEMYVRIEGSGFEGVKLSKINNSDQFPKETEAIPVSARELLVRIINPSATVKITLKNPSGVEISTVAVRPPDIDLVDEP